MSFDRLRTSAHGELVESCVLCALCGYASEYLTPSFSSAAVGQPFHSSTNTLPRYCRSAIPIFVDQNPLAVRSRKLLKNAMAWLRPGSGFEVYAISSSNCRRCASDPPVNGLPTRAIDSRSTRARSEERRVGKECRS